MGKTEKNDVLRQNKNKPRSKCRSAGSRRHSIRKWILFRSAVAHTFHLRVSQRLHVKVKLMRNGAAKQVSAGAAPWNMVGFVKPFWTSVARQVSRKVEPLSVSATVATIALVGDPKSRNDGMADSRNGGKSAQILKDGIAESRNGGKYPQILKDGIPESRNGGKYPQILKDGIPESRNGGKYP